jgi:hypothetical protein
MTFDHVSRQIRQEQEEILDENVLAYMHSTLGQLFSIGFLFTCQPRRGNGSEPA